MRPLRTEHVSAIIGVDLRSGTRARARWHNRRRRNGVAHRLRSHRRKPDVRRLAADRAFPRRALRDEPLLFEFREPAVKRSGDFAHRACRVVLARRPSRRRNHDIEHESPMRRVPFPEVRVARRMRRVRVLRPSARLVEERKPFRRLRPRGRVDAHSRPARTSVASCRNRSPVGGRRRAGRGVRYQSRLNVFAIRCDSSASPIPVAASCARRLIAFDRVPLMLGPPSRPRRTPSSRHRFLPSAVCPRRSARRRVRARA